GLQPKVINDTAVPSPDRTMAKLFSPDIEAVFVWNGCKSQRGRLRAELRAAGVSVLTMEHGFFDDRRKRVQIDHQGFSRMSSWCRPEVFKAKPEGGSDRLSVMAGGGPAIQGPRQAGYILVILQVPNDSQLSDSEIQAPGPLVRAVEASAPEGVEIRVRAHPVQPWNCGTNGRARMTKDKSLEEDIAGARFCITINSTAGVKALYLGCPVLCLGPAMYTVAGVAKQTSIAVMPEAIREMLAGWAPKSHQAFYFLCHLANHQWTLGELAQGDCLKALLEVAERCSPSKTQP
ncbi:unnamed protein product, partial [marine sediment metagenome]